MSHETPLRVLLVEDYLLLASRIAGSIARLRDVELVAIVATQADAISQIAAADPDVLILDLHLRSGTGIGVLRSMVRDCSATRPKVIVLTNFGLPEYRCEVERLGADAFLDKSKDYFRIPALLNGFAKERRVRTPN